VLNGLYSYEKSSDTQKVPGFGEIPLIGALFRSKGTVTNKREIAIIITPRIVNPTANSQSEPKDVNAQKLYEFDKATRDRGMLKKQQEPLTLTE
jgi:pilus assembly protein CpaC